jgi:formylglycine-generating enzyme required for sulfatase activity
LLPTEAQWEFAARGGNESKGYIYSGSDNIDDVAWYGGTYYGTQPVGTKTPNELGIYDMSGNVYEWVNDWYGEYSDLHQTDPIGIYTCNYKIARGGAWYSIPFGCRVSTRVYGTPYNSENYLGFRLVQLPLPIAMLEQ